MAVKIPGVWGIDLGQSALKAIRLEMKDGQVVATAFEYIEHPKILSQPDADPDELTREALTQFLSRNQIRYDVICIAVPGQSGLARFVKLPPVDEKKIADIVKFEAKQQIPFPLEEVVWDFQRLNKGDVIDGLALETEIGLFAMKRDMVNRAIAQFKDVNVEVHMVQMAPLALCNMVAYDLLGKEGGQLAEEGDANECIVALEIGTDSSNLVITDGGRIIWQRPIPIGGNHFTRALTKEMKLTFAKAEHLKKNAAKSPDLKKILSSLKQVLNDFVGEVQRSLGYFTNTHRNAQIQYMVGLGNAFRLPGLQKFLQEKLQLEVRKFQKLERTTGDAVTTAPTFAENIMSFGVAYGLALQGLKQAHLQTNLLPYEVRLERVIRGKKPWAVAAAACLIFGMFMLAFAQGMEKKAIINDVNAKAEQGADSIAKSVKADNDSANAKKTELESNVKVLDRIGAGVNERINWSLLHQYVNRSSPQPNGDRIAIKAGGRVKNIKDELWTKNVDAQVAFRVFEQKKLGQLKDLPKADMDAFNDFFRKKKLAIAFEPGKDLPPKDAALVEQFTKENLIQINIAGINALYAEDLGPYFRQIYTDGKILRGMSPADKAKVVAFAEADDESKRTTAMESLLGKEKDGWVVEIRGYTFNKGGAKGEDKDREAFVVDTIVENLTYPQGLDAAKDKEMIKRIQERVTYHHIYFSGQMKPGEPSQIAKSHLKRLVKGLAEGGGNNEKKDGMPGGPKMGDLKGGAPPPGGVQGAGGGGQKLERESWSPIGETASSVLVDGGGAPGGGMGGGLPGGALPGGGMPPPPPGGGKMPPMGGNDPKVGPPADANALVRTEFVLLFIWREPGAAAPAPNAEEKK